MNKRIYKYYAIIVTVCALLAVGLCFALYHAQTPDGIVMCLLGAGYIFAVCLIFCVCAFIFSKKGVSLFKSKKIEGCSSSNSLITMLILVFVLSLAMGTSWGFRWYNSTVDLYKTFGSFLSTTFMYAFLYFLLSIPTIGLGTIGLSGLYRNETYDNVKKS